MRNHGGSTAVSALVITIALSACAGPDVDRQEPASPTDSTADPVGSDPAGAESQATGQPAVVYACEDGRRLTVVFEDDRALVSTLRGAAPLDLPQQPVASGFGYASATHELRGQRRDATWTVGRMVPTACTALRP